MASVRFQCTFLYNKFGPKKINCFFSTRNSINCFFSKSITKCYNVFSQQYSFGSFCQYPSSSFLTLISEIFDKNIAKANAFHGVFGSIGVSLGPLISYFSLLHFSWHYAFIFTAILNAFLLPLSLKFIPNTEKIDIISFNDFRDKKQNSILTIFFLISFVVGLSFTVFNTFIPSVFN